MPTDPVPGRGTGRPRDPDPLGQALGLSLLAQEALEQPAVAFLVAQDGATMSVVTGVDRLGDLDDPVVVLDGAGLGLDDAADDVDDVGLALGRLEEGLLGDEVEAGQDTTP